MSQALTAGVPRSTDEKPDTQVGAFGVTLVVPRFLAMGPLSWSPKQF